MVVLSGSRHPQRTGSKQNAQSLYKSLNSQLEAGFFAAALKTTERLLRLNASDELAARTKLQLQIALDQFPASLESIASKQIADNSADEATLEEVYCLYKTGRESEAAEKLLELPVEVAESRAAKLLEAQVNYRLDKFETARDLYEDLIATADADAPELVDLQANLDACQSTLNFLAAVPSHLASTSIPPLEQLESRPVGPLLSSFHKAIVPSSRAPPVASTSALPATSANTAPKAPKGKLPKSYDQMKKAGKGPDPDRWLPYRERPGMAELIVAKRERARGRNREKERTQGGPVDDDAGQQKKAPATPAKGGAGGGGGKKKKGKK